MLNNLNISKFKFISSCRAGSIQFKGSTEDVTVMHVGFISKDPLKKWDTNIVDVSVKNDRGWLGLRIKNHINDKTLPIWIGFRHLIK